MEPLNCKKCGAAMQAAEGKTVAVCPNCQSEQETCPCVETSTPVMQAKKGRNKKALDARIRKMVMIAMFTAIAYVAMLFIHIKVGFLTMDVKDAVITLCGLFFGPLSALFIAVLVPVIELFTMSETGVYGLIMNIIGSVTFSVVVSLFYKLKKTLWGAIAGLAAGALTMVAAMMLANLFITPYYMGTTTEAVRQMIPTLLLPFNLLKGVINVGAVLLLYKPLSRVLRRLGVLPGRKKVAAEISQNGENSPRCATKSRFSAKSIAVTVAALILIAVSLVLIFAVLGGKFAFGIS